MRLVRDKDGNITGGRTFEVNVEPPPFTLTDLPPSVTRGPATPGEAKY
jgi:hypothetical protein